MKIKSIFKYSNVIILIASLIAIDTVLSYQLNSKLVIITVILAGTAFLAFRSTRKNKKIQAKSTVKSQAKSSIPKKDMLVLDSLNGIKSHLIHLSDLLDDKKRVKQQGANNPYLLNDMIMDSLLIVSTEGSNAYIIQEKPENGINKYHEKAKLKKLQNLFKRKGQRLNVLKAKDPQFHEQIQEADLSKENLTLDFPGNLINYN